LGPRPPRARACRADASLQSPRQWRSIRAPRCPYRRVDFARASRVLWARARARGAHAYREEPSPELHELLVRQRFEERSREPAFDEAHRPLADALDLGDTRDRLAVLCHDDLDAPLNLIEQAGELGLRLADVVGLDHARSVLGQANLVKPAGRPAGR